MPMTKKELRKRLLQIHKDGEPVEGDYDSYGTDVRLAYYDLLGDLGLAEKFEVDNGRDENNYVDNVIVRPLTKETVVPDVGDWGDDDVAKPTNIDECVEWWWEFYKKGKPPK